MQPTCEATRQQANRRAAAEKRAIERYHEERRAEHRALWVKHHLRLAENILSTALALAEEHRLQALTLVAEEGELELDA
jgi:hypothetical protein